MSSTFGPISCLILVKYLGTDCAGENRLLMLNVQQQVSWFLNSVQLAAFS